MSYASNAGTRIHYQTEGTGPPLILHHGLTQTLEDWRDFGYTAALRPHFRLILIDARGHGASAKPHDEQSYALPLRVADITAVLDAEAIDQAAFWGYSMGGFIGFGMAKFAPNRLTALVIGGAAPYDRIRTPMRTLLRATIPLGTAAIVAAFEPLTGPMPPTYATRLAANDFEAIAAMSFDEPGVHPILPTLAIPTCLYCGTTDPVFPHTQTAATEIPNARFIPLEGASHMEAFYHSETILPGVMTFLNNTQEAEHPSIP